MWLDSIAPNLKHIVESRIKATNEMPRRELAVRINAFAVKYIPIGLFCLVPVLAFFLKMLWGWRRRYADHFVFTLHAQATVFLFLAIFHFGPKELGAYHCVVAAIMLWTLWRAFAYVYGGGVLKRLALLVPTVAVYFFALILVLLSLVFFGFAFG